MCAYRNSVEGTVVFCLTVVCTADDRTFNALVFAICVHISYPPVVRYAIIVSRI